MSRYRKVFFGKDFYPFFTALANTENKALKEFLEYLNIGKAKSEFTKEIEAMIQTIKQNEQARQEYRLMSTFDGGASKPIKTVHGCPFFHAVTSLLRKPATQECTRTYIIFSRYG